MGHTLLYFSPYRTSRTSFCLSSLLALCTSQQAYSPTHGGLTTGLPPHQYWALPLSPWYVRPWRVRYSRIEDEIEAVELSASEPSDESPSSSGTSSCIGRTPGQRQILLSKRVSQYVQPGLCGPLVVRPFLGDVRGAVGKEGKPDIEKINGNNERSKTGCSSF